MTLTRCCPAPRKGLAAAIAAAALTLALAASSLAPPAGTTAAGRPAPSIPVLVAIEPGAADRASAAITALGGAVVDHLASLDTLVATIPAPRLDRLARAAGVVAATPDRALRLLGAATPEKTDKELAKDDLGSLLNLADEIGVTDLRHRGYSGAGVDVALIDSGIAPVSGLQAERVVNGPDLSFESQAANLHHLDTYGHGTHMASIIAGQDAGAGARAGAAGEFVGVAPGAR
ncbi:MAG: S8 family serine peptidase, partial [Acidimicrobiales bacterium]